MQYTTLGRTGLKVSVAGLGTGGFSRLGLKTGLTEDQSARLIHEAVALGVNFIDTAPSYGTEGVVGKAMLTKIVTVHIRDFEFASARWF